MYIFCYLKVFQVIMNPETFNVVLKFLEKMVKDEKEYQCKYCEEIFLDTKVLKAHSITQHMQKRFVCDFCFREYKVLQNLTTHIDQNHMDLNLYLNVKPKKPKPKVKEIEEDYEPETENETDDSDYDQYNDEGKKNKKPDREYPRKCDHCDYVVPMKRVHYQHYLFMHKDIIEQYPYGSTKIPCSICGVFKPSNRLGEHESKHRGIKVKCTICDKVFKSRSIMKQHMRCVHTERKLICHFCAKGFKTRLEITRHIRTHTGEKPFKCHICGAGFAHSGNRQIHIRSAHQNVKSISKKGKENKKNKEKNVKTKNIKKKEKKGSTKKQKGRPRLTQKVKMDSSDSESDNETLSVIQKKK